MNNHFKSQYRNAFTLLEILVALTILSIMVVFMFTIIDSTARLWRVGNKQMEAARAANIGMNALAENLSKIVCGTYSIQYSNGVSSNVVIPFESILNPSHTLNLGGGAVNAEGSQMLRAVVSTGDGSFKEIGLMCVFLSDEDGYDSMEGGRYYLVFKDLLSGTLNIDGLSSWPYNNGTTINFIPIIDNCVRLKFEYAIRRFTNVSYTNSGTTNWSWSNNAFSSGGYLDFTNNWTHTNNFEFPYRRMRELDPTNAANLTYDRLCGVLITATIIDSDTAEKIAQLTDGTALTEEQINAIFSGDVSNPIQRLLKSGAVTLKRFVPFNPPQY